MDRFPKLGDSSPTEIMTRMFQVSITDLISEMSPTARPKRMQE